MTPGQVCHVLIDVNHTQDLATLATTAAGLQAQLREDFAPEYGEGEDDIVRVDTTAQTQEIEYQIHGQAPADQQDALGFHARKPDGTPIIHVFADLATKFNVSLSSILSHEMLEGRVNPDLGECVQLPDGRIAAKEICDQVEAQTYSKNGVEVSNFNTRANFAPPDDASTPVKYDFLGKQTKYFQVEDGGYAQVLDPNQGWQQLGTGMSAYHAEMTRLGLSRHARILAKPITGGSASVDSKFDPES